MKPLIGTISGTVLGVIGIVIWAITFEPHGGLDLSWYLFPLSRLVLEACYTGRSVPVSLMFAAAVLQWTMLV